MFLLDDILLSPLKGTMFCLRAIHDAVDTERHDAERLVAELSELHALLERGEITEEEFDEREGPLLDALEAATETNEP